MSAEAESTTESAPEVPAGFPGEERVSLDPEAEATSRALSVLAARAEQPEAAETLDPEGGERVPEGEQEPIAEPPPAEEPAPADPPPAEPQVSDALAQVMALRQELDRDRQALAQEREEVKAILAEREQLDPLRQAQKLAKEENFFAAIEQLFPGAKPDDVIKAVAQGRGLERPEDKMAEVEKRIREHYDGELAKLRELQEQREAEETSYLVRSTVTASDMADLAPLVAAFGDQGVAAVQQLVDTHRASGSRVTRETVREAVSTVETELVSKFLTVALKSEAVRTKYADQLRAILPSGKRDQASPSNPGLSLSNRATSQTTRRASTEDLTEEERTENALRHLRR